MTCKHCGYHEEYYEIHKCVWYEIKLTEHQLDYEYCKEHTEKDKCDYEV